MSDAPKYAPELGSLHDATREIRVLTKQGWVTYEIKHEHGEHDDWCNGCRALDKREVR